MDLFFSSAISNCPREIFAWIFSATLSAARLLVPMHFALRFPLWSMKIHHLPLCCLTLTAIVSPLLSAWFLVQLPVPGRWPFGYPAPPCETREGISSRSRFRLAHHRPIGKLR